MLVKEKMKNNYLVNLRNFDEVSKYEEVGVTTFLLPLKKYCVGYPDTFSWEEINSLKLKNGKKYCLINAVLNNKSLDEVKNIVATLEVDGFVIEDIGLINVLKKLQKEVILFINHFNCNWLSINTWLDYVDSVFVSNELTYLELKEITSKCQKKVVIHLFGYNQVMYSKRKLLSNYQEYYNLPKNNRDVITDKMGLVKFRMYENEEGTVGYSDKIFADSRILDLSNVYYYYINSSFIELEKVLAFIKDKTVDDTMDSGFLDKETIFKIGGDSK